jgi:predicted ester cyclase
LTQVGEIVTLAAKVLLIQGKFTMSSTTIQERLAWNVTPELYDQIRRLWISHSIAEDNRNLQGLIDTLAEDCVYEIIPTGQRWEGHDGARNFYTSFLGAFPDVKFNMTDIVIGPQGVFEVTTMTGTQMGEWGGIQGTGQPVKLEVVIHFPWNPAAEKFAGERIYFDRSALTEQQESK